MHPSIPVWLNIGANGVLLAMFFVSLWVFSVYLIDAWQKADDWKSFYDSDANTAALSLLILSSGMVVKQVAAVWALNLLKNDLKPDPLVVPVFVGGTLISIWGLGCLLKALSRNDWPRWTWLALVGGALVLGSSLSLL